MPATAFCLHALGSSSEEFALLHDRLEDVLDLVGIDLPGFGTSPASSGTTVEDMVERVERAIGRSGVTEWALVGHSMGGKVAAIVADRTISGANGLFGLRGVVLLAASPRSPEPMGEDRRQAMLDWAAAGHINTDHAGEFVDANTAATLRSDRLRSAVYDVERTDPEAWRAWLERGSREDWSDDTTNPVPALVLAGAEDGDLGPSAQQELVLPHWPNGTFAIVPGAAHLLPWEQPDDVADRIRTFWERHAANGPVVPAEHARVIASPRVSATTRGALAARALADDPDAEPQVFTPAQLDTLRAVAAVVVPQSGGRTVDVALRVDAQLADGAGDGWRPDGLPTDVEAYRAALDELGAAASRDGATGDDHDGVLADELAAVLADVLAAIEDGSYEPVGPLTVSQLAAWAEDAAVDLAKQWLAHPATMAAIDYDGYANGGDGVRKQGFQLLGAGQREAWEAGPPKAAAALPEDTTGAETTR
ncbi:MULTISPECIES: alpha/beta fold hydrolase [Curtobacterium]|uniref:alpha/beta fold hydrolase n=1 Tax=Curtobacterium flaccumfaciens TaxID=2035 RepID=UPI003EE6ECF7